MEMGRIFLFLTTLISFASGEFGLAAQLFQLSGSSSVSNAKLGWPLVDGASSYQIQQSSGSGGYKTVANTSGDTADVYGLTVGTKYNFRINAVKGSSQLDQSSVSTVTPFTPQGKYNTYDNAQGSTSSAMLRSQLKANGVYYQYNYESASNGSFTRFVEQTSTDGYNFSGDRTVLTGSTLCASANYSCHLERIQFLKNPTNDWFVMWAHFERVSDYDLAEVAVAHMVTPGKSNLTFDGAFRPLGNDSRDMAFFADGDDAYLISAVDTNTNMNIYSLTSNWTAIDKFLVEVNKNGYREAPSVIKNSGSYYLFTSRAAGWLPSQPQYITASSMQGPWSNPVDVANTATFCTQSGSVNQLASGQFEMQGDQWSSNWPTAGGPTRDLMLPLAFSSSEFTTYNFYRIVKYSDNITTPAQGIFGVQTGRILSVGKPSSSNAGTQNISLANDGIQNVPGAYFTPSKVPFWYQINLQKASTVTQVDLTTNLVQGSETFYRFNVTGSSDGTTWTSLADESNNVNPGFVSAFPTVSKKVQYLRINVASVVNNVNGNEADFAVGVGEVTVYGSQ